MVSTGVLSEKKREDEIDAVSVIGSVIVFRRFDGLVGGEDETEKKPKRRERKKTKNKIENSKRFMADTWFNKPTKKRFPNTLEHLQPHSIFHSKIEFKVKNALMVLYFSLYNRVKNRFTLNIE